MVRHFVSTRWSVSESAVCHYIVLDLCYSSTDSFFVIVLTIYFSLTSFNCVSHRAVMKFKWNEMLEMINGSPQRHHRSCSLCEFPSVYSWFVIFSIIAIHLFLFFFFSRLWSEIMCAFVSFVTPFTRLLDRSVGGQNSDRKTCVCLQCANACHAYVSG